jgi:transcription termination factor Rho
MDIFELEKKTVKQLSKIAKDLEIPNLNRLKREGLIIKIAQSLAEAEGLEMRGGVLEIMNEGIGLLRGNYRIGSEDVYVSQAQLRRYELRSGDLVIGHVRPPRESERHHGLLKVESINGLTPDEARKRPKFENLTPIFPNKFLNLEYDPLNLATRMMNLVAPIGGGQRAMIVSPPKAGKTTILKDIANAISANNPEVRNQIMSLIGERPEEVTDMDR